MFAQRLKSLRKEAKMSQKDLADRIFSAQNTISNWETGTREPNFETFKKLVKLFNVSADYLLGIEETKTLKGGEAI